MSKIDTNADDFKGPFDKIWWDNLPDYEPRLGRRIERFGLKLYEFEPYPWKGKQYQFKDAPDEAVIQEQADRYVMWNGKATCVRDIDPDLMRAIELSLDCEWADNPYPIE